MEFQAGMILGIARVQNARSMDTKRVYVQIQNQNFRVFTHLQIFCMLLAPVGLIPIISWNLDLE